MKRKGMGKIETMFAESENVCVYECGGGCLHLQFGRVSMAVTVDEFTEIATVLKAAYEQMRLQNFTAEGRSH